MGDIYAHRIVYEDHDWVFGLDEVGWGPIAGPLTAATVVLPRAIVLPKFIKDSKKLSEKKRLEAYDWIMSTALYVDCDSINAHRISQLGAGPAREALFTRMVVRAQEFATEEGKTHFTLIDGNYLPPLEKVSAVIKGDTKISEISAASIVAKVRRDYFMVGLAASYPEFGWEWNKGYATKAHIKALEEYGKTTFHRMNVKLVARTTKEYDEEVEYSRALLAIKLAEQAIL